MRARIARERSAGWCWSPTGRCSFLTTDPARNRTGYELTVVDLRFDDHGGISGTMSGAARVKPSPDGPVLGDFAEAPGAPHLSRGPAIILKRS